MGRPKVVVTSPSFCAAEDLLRELRDLDVDLKINRDQIRFDTPGLIQFLGNTQIAIIGTETVNAQVLDGCPNLKVICKYGVGTDNLDLAAMAVRGIALGWSGGVNRRSVTELALAFMLGHVRNVIPSIVKMRQGIWQKQGGREISHMTVGLVGLGHIGTDLAAILRALGARVLYTDIADRRLVAEALELEACTYEELIKASDIISFHVPSTPETRGMFGTKQLPLVRPHVLVVNTARGNIVDFDVVCKAVDQGRLGGFAADVFPEEPADLRSWTHPALYFTPHIGGNAQEAVLAMGRSAIAHLRAYLEKSR